MTKSFLFLLFIALLPLFLSAQFNANKAKYPAENIKGEEAKFYIPYNDHGVWGYADTLGRIVIEPFLQDASLFWPRKMGPDAVYNATVTTDVGKNFLLPSLKFLLPKKVSCEDQIINLLPTEKDVTIFVVKKKDRYALYRSDKGRMTKFKFDEINDLALSAKLFCLRDRKTKLYHRFLPNEQAFVPTPCTSFTEINYVEKGQNYIKSQVVGLTANADTFAIKEGSFVPFSIPRGSKVQEELYYVYDPSEIREVPPPPNARPSSSQPNRRKGKQSLQNWAKRFEVDDIMDQQQFSNVILEKYNFFKLVRCSKKR